MGVLPGVPEYILLDCLQRWTQTLGVCVPAVGGSRWTLRLSLLLRREVQLVLSQVSAAGAEGVVEGGGEAGDVGGDVGKHLRRRLVVVTDLDRTTDTTATGVTVWFWFWFRENI